MLSKKKKKGDDENREKAGSWRHSFGGHAPVSVLQCKACGRCVPQALMTLAPMAEEQDGRGAEH